MKTNTTIMALIGVLAIMLGSCDPIIDDPFNGGTNPSGGNGNSSSR